MKKTKNEFLTKIYENELRNVKEIKEIAVYEAEGSWVEVYASFEYKKEEYLLGYTREGVDASESLHRKIMATQVRETEKLRREIRSQIAHETTRDTYLRTYAMKLYKLKYGYTGGVVKDLKEYENIIKKYINGPFKFYKEGAYKLCNKARGK